MLHHTQAMPRSGGHISDDASGLRRVCRVDINELILGQGGGDESDVMDGDVDPRALCVSAVVDRMAADGIDVELCCVREFALRKT